MYLADGYPGTGLLVIDTATNQISREIKIRDPGFMSPDPTSVAFSSSGRFGYVTSGAQRSNRPFNLFVSKIDTTSEKQITSTNLGAGYNGLVSVNGRKVYVTNPISFDQSDIIVLNSQSNRVVKRISSGGSVVQSGLTPDGQYLYVMYPDIPGLPANQVATIDTATGQLVGSPIQVGQGGSESALAIAPTDCAST